MAWLQITFRVSAEQSISVERQFAQLGALAVTLTDGADQPIYGPDPDTTPLWQATQVTALFADDSNPQLIVQQMQAALPQLDLKHYRVSPLADKVWERECMADFKPVCFGKKLWLCPSWCTPPDPQGVNVMLDPGLAFGSGSHPSTALCLAWLDQCDQQLADKTVIDYGCGSGILSIAALSLGAAMVYGIDHDDQALIATRDNARRNGIDPQRLVVSPPQDLDLAFTADILLANILAAPLIELAPRLAGHTKVGGQLVLAGILADQAEAVMVAYRPWFADIGISGAQDEWVRLTASKGSV